MSGHGLLCPLGAPFRDGIADGHMLIKDDLGVDGVVIHRLDLKPEIVVQEQLALPVEQAVLSGRRHCPVEGPAGQHGSPPASR